MAGGTRETITTTEPWSAQRGYLESGFGEAANLYNRGMPAYYGGPTLAGFDPSQTAAQQAILGYAMGPRAGAMQAGAENALLGQMAGTTPFSQQQSQDLLAGNVRTGQGTPFGALSNVYAQDYLGQIAANMPAVRQQMVEYQPGGGSRGDIAQANVINAASKNLGQNLARMYGGAYDVAQGQRLPAAQMALDQRQAGLGAYPSIMAAPLGMYDAIGDVGSERQSMTQANIDRAMDKYNYGAMRDYNALNQYMNTIAGNYGGTTTQTTPGPGVGGMLGSILPALLGIG